ncbi:MAG TPA: outer membrane beta-barrel protein [Gemmatimonadales bacterium]
MSILKLATRAPAILAAATLVSAIPRLAVAQGGLELTPWAGAYIPTRNSFSRLGGDVFNRDVSVIGGARLTFWGNNWLGFEATGGYAPAKIGGETINETRTDLLAASGRLLLGVSPATNRVGVFLAAGPALLTRGSNPFDDDRSRTDFGGNAGIGFRFALNDRGSSALRLDFEDYLYNGDFGGGDKFQNDLVASLGLSIGLSGPGQR